MGNETIGLGHDSLATKASDTTRESVRLTALHNSRLLDTPRDPRFDRITTFARNLLDVPVALISLVDSDRQWFKSCVGFDATETSREVSFCAHAIEDDGVMVVPDASIDPRFRDNPLVTGEPGIRFYAGHPIRSARGGPLLGTLCVIDTEPRDINAGQLRTLEMLAEMVNDEIELYERSTLVSTQLTDFGDEFSRLMAVVDAVESFVAVLSPDGIVLELNASASRAIGEPREDIRNKNIWETGWWAPDAAIRDTMQEAVLTAASGRTANAHFGGGQAKLGWQSVDLAVTPVRDAEGTITCLIASAVDVSESVRLRTERDHLSAVVDKTPDFVAIYSTTGDVTFINEAGRKMTGIDLAALAAGTSTSDVHPRWAAQMLQSAAFKAAEFEGTWEGELALTSATGEEIPVSQAIVAHYDPAGSLTHYSTIARNIQEQRESEQELATSERQFRGTFENAAVGMAHVDLDGRWIRVNDRVSAILGYTPEELMQTKYQTVTHPDDLDNDGKLEREIIDGREENIWEKRYVKKNGETIWARVTVTLRRGAKDEPLYFISIIEDISEQKAQERQTHLLLGELNHRVKNTLAMIQSIANQTARDTVRIDEFVRMFQGRLQALSETHNLLTNSSWTGASISDLVREQAGLNGIVPLDRFTFSGPAIEVASQIALNFGLVLHELTTNALKYGALSNTTGHVDVTWSLIEHVGARADLSLTWEESGGPEILAPPSSSGFGTMLVQTGVEAGLGGQSDVQWNHSGLKVAFTIPMAESQSAEVYFPI